MSVPTFETSPTLSKLPYIRHGFFGRVSGGAGELNVSDTIGDKDAATANRLAAIEALGAKKPALIRLKQIHSDRVLLINEDSDTSRQPEADGMATNVPGFMLSIVTADCVPVLFADNKAGIVGACHAGREGALAGVIENTILAMVALGAEPERIVAAIGPSISGDNYEIGEKLAGELLQRDTDTNAFISTPEGGQPHFDLPGYAEARLKEAGLAAIERVGGCTYAHPDRYFSHRHFTHHGKGEGRQISMISISR